MKLFLILLVAVVSARAEVTWIVSNPWTDPVYVKVTDMSGPASEGWPIRGTFRHVLGAGQSIKFATPRFDVAIYRFESLDGYNLSAAVYNAEDGAVVMGYEGNVYLTNPLPSTPTGGASGGIFPAGLDDAISNGFVRGFTLCFPVLLFGLVLRYYRRLGDTNPSL